MLTFDPLCRLHLCPRGPRLPPRGSIAFQTDFLLYLQTRVSVLLDREAKRRRKSGEDPNIYGPGELKATRLDLHEMVTIMTRPFVMFVKEPIVLFLSLLSGFSDALIFTCLESFAVSSTLIKTCVLRTRTDARPPPLFPARLRPVWLQHHRQRTHVLRVSPDYPSASSFSFSKPC